MKFIKDFQAIRRFLPGAVLLLTSMFLKIAHLPGSFVVGVIGCLLLALWFILEVLLRKK